MGQPKALLDWHGETVLDHMIGVMADRCSPVVVVLGHQAQTIHSGMRRSDVRIAVNPDPDRGMLTSLQAGLREVSKAVDTVLFTPVDYPGIRKQTIATMLEEFQRGAAFVIPRFGGKHGHPVLMASEMIGEFLALPETSEAREVVHRHRDRTIYVDVEDEGILRDMDDPAAYEALRRLMEAV